MGEALLKEGPQWLWGDLTGGGMLQVLQLLATARAPVPHPLLDVSSALRAPTRHFCNEDGSLHLFPRESSSLRPFLPRVAIKELIHFSGLCYSGGSSPCTQQASSLLPGQQRWQKPRYWIYNFIHIFASIAD